MMKFSFFPFILWLHSLSRGKVPIALSSYHFFLSSLLRPPSLPLHHSPSLFFFSSFSNRTREGCLHAYKAVGVHALEEKHGGGRTLLERVLKTAVGEEKEKVAKEGEGCERAGTG